MRPRANHIAFPGVCVFNLKQEDVGEPLFLGQAILGASSGLAWTVELEGTLPA